MGATVSALLATAAVTLTLFVALLLGRWLHALLPEHHLSSDSKDAVKLAMGLVATMTALLLGLLVSSAKSNYDTQRNQVIQMAAKVEFLDRLLSLYGTDTADARTALRGAVVSGIRRVWPDETGTSADLSPDMERGDALYAALQRLAPRDDTQRALKTEAVGLALDLAQLRTLLRAQSLPSVSATLLVVVAAWLVVIFLSTSTLAPPNATTTVALAAAACSVAAAIFLILELDQPFSGLLHVSSAPMQAALSHLGS